MAYSIKYDVRQDSVNSSEFLFNTISPQMNGLYNHLNEVLGNDNQFEPLNEAILDPSKLSVSRARTPTNSVDNSSTSSPISMPTRNAKEAEFGLAWIDLTFSPKMFMTSKTKTILRSISGQIKFGNIVGLMGPSGCGKSTLLKCINGRIESGLSEETQIYVSKDRQIYSCFIVQDQKEHLLLSLTTKESLLYASKIKNQYSEEDEDSDSIKDRSNVSLTTCNGFDHMKNINKLLFDLTLTDCADTLIVNCSGGQQKRIVIALELVGNEKPNIMCIDEPTSGLDSNAAEQVIECLRNVSREHQIGIVTTIHQPNSDVLMMFDSLYVLSKGGYCVYNGLPEQLRDFLQTCNIAIKERQVPIEVLLKVSSKINYSCVEDRYLFDVDEEIKTMSNLTSQRSRSIKRHCERYGKLTDVKNINVGSVGFNFEDFYYLFLRTLKCTLIRGYKSILFITLFELFGGISTCLLFGETGRDDGCLPFDPSVKQNITCILIDPNNNLKKEQITVQNMKLLFFTGVIHNFLQLCATVLTFPPEVKIFFNEQQNRWYSSGSYYWAKNLVDSAIGLLVTYLFTYITYALTHQEGMNSWYNGFYKVDHRFAIYLLANILCTLNTQGMAYAFSILAARNLKAALCLAIGGNLVNTLFSGFFIPIHELNNFLQMFSSITYIKIAFETQIIAVYGLNRCDPNKQQFSGVLYQMQLKHTYEWNIQMLVLQLIAWRLIALFSLIIKTNDMSINPNLNLFSRHNAIKSDSLFRRHNTIKSDTIDDDISHQNSSV